MASTNLNPGFFSPIPIRTLPIPIPRGTENTVSRVANQLMRQESSFMTTTSYSGFGHISAGTANQSQTTIQAPKPDIRTLMERLAEAQITCMREDPQYEDNYDSHFGDISSNSSEEMNAGSFANLADLERPSHPVNLETHEHKNGNDFERTPRAKPTPRKFTFSNRDIRNSNLNPQMFENGSKIHKLLTRHN